jgi:DNA-directed RNA polymerase subunit beta
LDKLNKLNNRHSFEKIKTDVELPNLLDLQIGSFHEFLQEDISPSKRELSGLHEAFKSIFPLQDNHENYILEYMNYSIGKPRYSPRECSDRGITYSVSLKVKLKLKITDENDKKKIAEEITQDVYFGNIPYMTNKGTFIINGAERTVVTQLQRSPGAFFDQSFHPNGAKLFNARIIPIRGSWIDFTTDINDILFTIIDRKRKFPATLLLRSLGFSSDEDIYNAFDLVLSLDVSKINSDDYSKYIIVDDIIDKSTGELFAESGKEINDSIIKALKDNNTKIIKVVNVKDNIDSMMINNTIKKDPTKSTEEALIRVYSLLRGSDAPSAEAAQKFIDRMFFHPKKYDLGQVGRYRLDKQFDLNNKGKESVLTHDDFIVVIKYLILMRKGLRRPDDIDHLGNRRVRTVGEQLKVQFNSALSRMIRTVYERMNLRESETITPQDLINSRLVTTVINTFFGTSPLSQFGDQTNPLAEITHKRRISSLGPGGLSRERAGFEVRDVHYTHYGRLCPIETPEGPNIGLISSLALMAKINNHGFIEAPYRKVEDKIVTNKIEYLSADDEDRTNIAQSGLNINNNNKITDSKLRVRSKGDFPIVDSQNVQYTDIVPNQILSVAAALIPFVEHDDANRALMGSNMQRQSVPLLKTESPIVATGMERKVAIDSKAVVLSPVNGTVVYVDSKKIVIKDNKFPQRMVLKKDENLCTIELLKYSRSNQNTCYNQKAIVKEGQKVKIGDVIADGAATNNGELSLGKNVLVAFMPWNGYNFEDAIVISEKLVKEDIFTSLHINEIELEVRDTKRGEEELTPEIPNVSEDATSQLDEDGLIRVGAIVNEDDILIGKVTPKGETDPSPEEKLLRAIFGEKAGDVKDASKKAEPGVKGVVISTDLYKKTSKQSKAKVNEMIKGLQKQKRESERTLRSNRDNIVKALLNNKICLGVKAKRENKVLVKKGAKFTSKKLDGLNFGLFSLKNPWVSGDKSWEKIVAAFKSFDRNLIDLDEKLELDIFKLKEGDQLQPGILKLAKVYVANKRKISIGDKMAGRHGNKGVVATIVPEENMPFLEDGTPVDICLNPMGVPSRMNLGQLYETMLGWAGKILGEKYETPVFNGATPDEVTGKMKEAGLPSSGKVTLYDGLTGDKIDNPVLVGYMYMMKLFHMVDDKMHARSTGPYSLVTQQPLGGKAQFGGQRFGEMEVWALQAYGAAHLLREMLTIKSDDIEGRSKVYSAIVKGEDLPEPSRPEAFNVFMKELQGLGLDVTLD